MFTNVTGDQSHFNISISKSESGEDRILLIKGANSENSKSLGRDIKFMLAGKKHPFILGLSLIEGDLSDQVHTLDTKDGPTQNALVTLDYTSFEDLAMNLPNLIPDFVAQEELKKLLSGINTEELTAKLLSLQPPSVTMSTDHSSLTSSESYRGK